MSLDKDGLMRVLSYEILEETEFHIRFYLSD